MSVQKLYATPGTNSVQKSIFFIANYTVVILLGTQVKFCRLHKPVVGSITCTSYCLGKEAALLHLGNRPKKIVPIHEQCMYLTSITGKGA